MTPTWQSGLGPLRFVFACLAVSFVSIQQADADDSLVDPNFDGWQELRVINLDNRVKEFTLSDLDGDGREEILVTNASKGRLEIIEWLVKGNRLDEFNYDPNDPNILPMAPEFKRTEIGLESIPSASLAVDVDGDGTMEIAVLLLSPPQLVFYRQVDGSWKKFYERDLVDGKLAKTTPPLLYRESAQGRELLISMTEGIQRFPLVKDGRPEWMTPKNEGPRSNWWFADVDKDGDEDLIDWTSRDKGFQWFENRNGDLLPAIRLGEDSYTEFSVFEREDGGAEFLGVAKTQRGVVKRLRLEKGESSPIGKQRSISLPKSSNIWSGFDLEGSPAVVMIDGKRPVAYVHRLLDAGWGEEMSFPVVADIESIRSPVGQSGLLLIHSKEANDLHVSRWEQGRLTFPRPLEGEASAEDREIVTLSQSGEVVWWVQRVEKDLDLYTWSPGEAKPKRERFEGIGAKADQVKWLGEGRLLVLEQYARSPKLATLGNGSLEEPGQLKKMKLSELLLVPASAQQLKLAKIADGVLQWLDSDLHPTDQVMLPEGKALASYIQAGDREAWALERGGQAVYQLKPDSSGVYRSVEKIELQGGANMLVDPKIGVVLEGTSSLTVLSEGRPWKLELIEPVDNRIGRPAGVKEAFVHRIQATNACDGPAEEVLFFDDIRRQLTLLTVENDKLKALASWPTYEDKTYPYGGASGRDKIAEPRLIRGGQLDNDNLQDLVFIAHDRLVVYLAREEQ